LNHQRKEDLDEDEEFAVERLCSWLSRVHGADPLAADDVLDETQREFLLSYRLPDSAGADASPGRSPNGRQYILPQRPPRLSEGMVSPEASRASSEEAEAINDPELQEQLRQVRHGGNKPAGDSPGCCAGGRRALLRPRGSVAL
jgi:hypothetical protein